MQCLSNIYFTLINTFIDFCHIVLLVKLLLAESLLYTEVLHVVLQSTVYTAAFLFVCQIMPYQ